MNRTETKKVKKLDFQNIYVDLRNRELNNKKINNCFFYFLTPKKSVIVNVCVWVSIIVMMKGMREGFLLCVLTFS